MIIIVPVKSQVKANPVNKNVKIHSIVKIRHGQVNTAMNNMKLATAEHLCEWFHSPLSFL